jgi:NAD(P)H-hydrate epimerase
MQSVDRTAIEEYRIALLSMMENAGRGVASVVRNLPGAIRDGEPAALDAQPVTFDAPPARVVVLAGGGNNGGGGLVTARHLANRGVDVSIVLDRSPSDLEGPVAQHTETAFALDCPVHCVPESEQDSGLLDVLDTADVLVDAVVGYGLDGPLRGHAATLVDLANRASPPVVSLDVPTGRDATSGEVLGDAVRPTLVVTLALPKTGLESVTAPIVLADIGLPPALFRSLDISYENPFVDDTVVLEAA